ncbi:MAG: hypothetical protein J07HX5_00041 [halophilic archaeon J07HX5]|nr:MAG: hypothetical protein J07HX5_00041 [halophilic archaeon J07HX5]
MHTERPALGEMLEDFVKLGSIEFRSEPLNAASREQTRPQAV